MTWFLALAERERLEAYDPQATTPTDADERVIHEIKSAVERELGDSNLRIWRDQAQQGDPVAMNELGNCYSEGSGVEQSYSRAF